MRKMWGLRFISALLIAVLLLSELKVTVFAGEVEIVEFEEETENVYNSEESLIDETFTEIGQSASDIVSEEDEMDLETFSDDENLKGMLDGLNSVIDSSYDDEMQMPEVVTEELFEDNLELEGEGIQKAMWFMDVVYLTQLPGDGYSHAGTQNFDIVGYGNNNIFAPFDCVVRAKHEGSLYGNTVIIESKNPVEYADGTIGYMSMAFGHDNDISDIWIGREIKQGEVFYQTGNCGASGVHSHVTCIRGKYQNDMWTRNSQGNYSSPNGINPVTALFLSKDTRIINSLGLNFKVVDADHPPIAHVDNCVGVPGGIRVTGWAYDPDTPNQSINVHCYLDGRSGTGAFAKAFPATYESDKHHFDFTMPCSAGTHTLYLYAINTNGVGHNPEINNDGANPSGFSSLAFSGGTKTIPDGDYHILSVVDPSYRIDSSGHYDISKGKSPSNNTKVSLHKANFEEDEYFHFTYKSNGFYEISQGGAALDVPGGNMNSGTQVEMYQKNSSLAQEWAVIKYNQTDYMIKSACNGFNLDLNTAVASEGQKIGANVAHSNANQRWRLLPKGTQTIADGTYRISTSIDNSKYLYCNPSINNKVSVSSLPTEALDQQNTLFNIKYLGQEYYQITNIDGYSLEVSGGNIDAGAGAQVGENIAAKSSNSSANKQCWVIKNEGNGYYSIISKCNALYLDVLNSDVTNGNKIQMCWSNNSAAQKWKFERQPDQSDRKVEPYLFVDNDQISQYFNAPIDDEEYGEYFVRGCRFYNPTGEIIKELGMELWDKDGITRLDYSMEDVDSCYLGTNAESGWFYEGVNNPNPGSVDTMDYPIEPKENYRYRFYMKTDDGEYYYSDFYNVSIKGVYQPNQTTVYVDKADVRVNETIKVAWNLVKGAKGYEVNVTLDGNDTFARKIECDSNTAEVDVALPYEGTYTVSVVTKGRQNSEPAVYGSKINAHAPCEVTFVMEDEDGNEVELYRKTVPWGDDAVVDAPEREGYLFQGWDSSVKNIREDKKITALFQKRKYTVYFYSYDGKEVLSKQVVEYKDAAVAPEPPEAPKVGYVFAGWSSNEYECVKGPVKVSASYVWKDMQLPILLQDVSCHYEEDGYTVTYSIQNYDEERTSGRAIVALKTETGKLLVTTESNAFSIAKGGSKTNMEVFVPYAGIAKTAEIIIVNSFAGEIPISENISVPAVREWSEWSETEPVGKTDVESRTEYSSRKKVLTTSSSASLNGWTLYDTKVSYGAYGAWKQQRSPISSSDTREVQTVQVSDNNGYTREVYEYYKRPGQLDFTPYDGGGWEHRVYEWRSNQSNPRPKQWRVEEGAMSYAMDPPNFSWGVYYNWELWWLKSSQTVPATTHTEYRYRDRSKTTTYCFEKWGDWSEYSSEPVTASADCEVRQRTTYRYMEAISGDSDLTGTERTISGKVSEEFAGKQAMLVVYKGVEPADYNNEYIGQTVIGDDGSYSFTYVTREDPTEITGDFTIDLSIQGATSPIFLDKILAPKPKYTVRFLDWNGSVLSTQEIYEGGNAVLPADPVREHHVFRGWDNGVANIKDNVDISAIYDPEVHTVTFIDWKTGLVETSIYDFDQELELPDEVSVEGYDFAGWFDGEGQKISEGTPIQKDMVLNAEYTVIEYTVNIYDFDNQLVSTQKVEYGKAADLGATPEKAGMVFKGWNSHDYTCVKSDLDLYPTFEYVETSMTPVADIPSGDLSAATTLHLTAAEGAEIFYTIGGEDPTVHSEKYVDGISITSNTVVKYIAVENNKNISPIGISTFLLIDAEDESGGLSIKKTSYAVEKGEIFNIGYFVSAGYTAENVIFYSMNEKVAKVNSDGSIIAFGVGETEILAMTDDSKYGDFCNVIVSSSVIPVESLTVETQLLELHKDEIKEIEVTVAPENATYKDVSWFSSNPSVVRVDQNGTLCAVGYGSALLNVFSSNGNYKVSCYAEVSDPYLELNTNAFSVYVAGGRQLACEKHGSIESELTWYSEEPSIATVSETGLVSGIRHGSTKIHCATADGTYDVSAVVVVSPREASDKEMLLESDVNVVEQIHFTGHQLTPEVKVIHNGVILTEGYDYEMVYSNNVKVGKGKVCVIGTGDFTGKINKTFDIIPADEPIVSGFRVMEIPDQEYTGSALKPPVVVYDGDVMLEEGLDYTLSYKNNTVVTSVNKPAIATVNGKGQYTNKVDLNFNIVPKDIASQDIEITYDSAISVPKKETAPAPKIKVGKNILKAKKDYIVSYRYDMTDNYVQSVQNAGTVFMKIEGIGNYNGYVEKKFIITDKVMMNKATVTLSKKSFMYSGSENRPTVTVKAKLDGRTLTVVDEDQYEVIYHDNIQVGTALVEVVAKDGSELAGSKTVNFTITGLKMNGVKVSGIVNKEYSGNPVTQDGLSLVYSDRTNGEIELTDEDYDISYDNNVNAGTASVILTGRGLYTGSIKKTFKINPVMLTSDDKVEISCSDTAEYDKAGAIPSLTVKYNKAPGNALQLTENVDYKVKYTNNKKLGTASFAISGMGNYKGTISNAENIFTVTAKSIKNPSVEISVGDAIYKDGKISYEPKITIKDGKTSLSKNRDYTISENTATNVASLGTSIYSLKISGIGNYSDSTICYFRVAEADFSKAKAKLVNKIYYTGAAITPGYDELDVTIKSGKNTITLSNDDFDIVGYSDNTKVGTGYILLKGKGTYGGELKVKMVILPRWIKNLKMR